MLQTSRRGIEWVYAAAAGPQVVTRPENWNCKLCSLIWSTNTQHLSSSFSFSRGLFLREGRRRGWEMGRGEAKEWHRREEQGPQGLVYTPCPKSWKILGLQNWSDWRGGNTDVCPGRQTSSRRHCVRRTDYVHPEASASSKFAGSRLATTAEKLHARPLLKITSLVADLSKNRVQSRSSDV